MRAPSVPGEPYRHLHRAGPAGARLLLALHGSDGDGSEMLEALGSRLPPRPMLAPRGDVTETASEGETAVRFFRRFPDGRYDPADIARARTKLRGFLRERSAALDGARIDAVGYSNGANMLCYWAAHDPAPFGRIVLMHPVLPPLRDTASLVGLDVLVTAGRSDPRCSWQGTRRLAGELRERGADVRVHAHDGGHEVAPMEWDAAAEFLARTPAPTEAPCRSRRRRAPD